MQECGTDALRFALCAYTAQGRDVNLDIKRVVAYRHWCNKLWNAVKFAMQYLGPPFTALATPGNLSCPAAAPEGEGEGTEQDVPFAARWILSRLASTAALVNSAFDAYDFSTTTTAIYSYWQYDVCDTFIELIKPTMRVRAALRAD
jgi:valyl-tRNA synthetase